MTQEGGLFQEKEQSYKTGLEEQRILEWINKIITVLELHFCG